MRLLFGSLAVPFLGYNCSSNMNCIFCIHFFFHLLVFCSFFFFFDVFIYIVGEGRKQEARRWWKTTRISEQKGGRKTGW